MKNNKKILIVFVALTFVVFGLGQGCAKMYGTGGEGDISSLNQTPPDELEIIPNTKTTSMTYNRQLLDSMVSCTGIQKATDDIKKVFEERQGSLSEYGFALEVSPPMLMAATAISGEVCNQLIAMEASSSSPRIFTNIDFNREPASLSDGAVGNSVRRLARSCWLRNETDEELQVITSSMRAAFPSGGEAKDAMLMVCTAMLSSLSGMEM